MSWPRLTRVWYMTSRSSRTRLTNPSRSPSRTEMRVVNPSAVQKGSEGSMASTYRTGVSFMGTLYNADMRILPTLVLAAGCVSSGKYDALQKQLDETKATLTHQLGEKDGQLKAKDDELAACKSKGDQSAEDVKRCETARAKLE